MRGEREWSQIMVYVASHQLCVYRMDLTGVAKEHLPLAEWN